MQEVRAKVGNLAVYIKIISIDISIDISKYIIIDISKYIIIDISNDIKQEERSNMEFQNFIFYWELYLIF